MGRCTASWRLALRTGNGAGDLAAQFAALLDAGYSTGLRLNQLTDANSGLAARLGRLLACIDVVLAAACTPQAVHDRAEDLRRGYYLEYQSLLRQAEQKGLPSDYTSAPAAGCTAQGTAQSLRPAAARLHRERRTPCVSSRSPAGGVRAAEGRPLRVEGIGKSSFAARFPQPVFIDTEGGTGRLDVQRLPAPDSWQMLLDEAAAAAAGQVPCQTLVLDTADWAEKLCMAGVCDRFKVKGIEDIGYGKGYIYVKEDFARLLDALDKVAAAGRHVVVVAHAAVARFEQARRGGQLRPLGHENIQAGGPPAAGMVRYAPVCQLQDGGGKERHRPQRQKQSQRRPPGAVHHTQRLTGTQRTASACRTRCPSTTRASAPL